MWVFDEDVGMNQREITYVPGLYKIFDEILGELKLLEALLGDGTADAGRVCSENRIQMKAADLTARIGPVMLWAGCDGFNGWV